MMPENILELQNLSKFYTGTSSVVIGLNNISLSFKTGEFVAVTGESGSGKSTLGHVIGGILPYENGELLLRGKPTSYYDGTDWEHYRRDNISFISQNYGILPGNTVLGNVTSVLRLVGFSEREARAEAKKILVKVELWNERSKRAARLSSGQKQRLSIARALAKPSAVLVADEPTGNLDSENGINVIKLLADAARERLVIMITHDYKQAEPYVTRHIVIQDGHVASDGAVESDKKTEASEEKPCEEKYESATLASAKKSTKKGAHSFYVSRLQMKMHPVWCAVMLFFLTVTAFAVFVFLGTFISVLDDTNTRIYNNTAFRNGSTDRLVVMRNDRQYMSDSDAEKILGIKNIVSVERYGAIADVKYYYRENTDYIYINNLKDIGSGLEPVYIQFFTVEFKNTDNFMHTVPVTSESDTFLTSGRLPQNYFEVVANEGDGKIGDKIRIFLSDEKNWASGSYIAIDAEIVGLTSESGLYFDDSVASMITSQVLHDGKFICVPRSPDSYGAGETEENYPADIMRCSSWCMISLNNYYSMYKWPYGEGKYPCYCASPELCVEENVTVFGFEGGYIDQGVEFDAKSSPFIGNIFAEIKASTFYKITDMSYGEQFSVTIKDYAYAQRVIEKLNETGYIAISPFMQNSGKQDAALAEERLNTIKICLIALAVVMLLEIILIRALFSVEKESYALLSNIGLTCRSAVNSVMIQLIFFTVIGECICAAAIYVLGGYSARIGSLLSYLEPPQIALLFAFHFITATIAALWTGADLKRRVFPFTHRFTDIDFDDGGSEENKND